jgi:hypothetical protein
MRLEYCEESRMNAKSRLLPDIITTWIGERTTFSNFCKRDSWISGNAIDIRSWPSSSTVWLILSKKKIISADGANSIGS